MFDLSWTSLLGLTGLGSIGILGLAAYFLGLRAVVEAVMEFAKPILRFAAETLVKGLQAFGRGLKGLIDNLSDLVTLAVVVFMTFAATTGYYKMQIKDIQFIHKQEMAKVGKKPKQIQEGGFWPWEGR